MAYRLITVMIIIISIIIIQLFAYIQSHGDLSTMATCLAFQLGNKHTQIRQAQCNRNRLPQTCIWLNISGIQVDYSNIIIVVIIELHTYSLC